MHLVLNHVTKLEEVGDTHCSRLVETLSCFTIIEICRTKVRKSCLICPLCEVLKFCTIKDRCCKLHTELASSSSEDGLENLAEVHTRRHTKRVKHQVNWSSVCEERHILLANNLRNNTLVTVASCQFVSYTDLTLLGNIYLCHLQNSRGKLVTYGDSKLLALHLSIKQLELLHEVDDQLRDKQILMGIGCPVADMYVTILKILEVGNSECTTLSDNLRTGIVLNALRHLTFGQFEQLVDEYLLQVVNLCLVFLVNLGKSNLILHLCLTGLDGTLEEFLVDDNTSKRRIGLE